MTVTCCLNLLSDQHSILAQDISMQSLRYGSDTQHTPACIGRGQVGFARKHIDQQGIFWIKQCIGKRKGPSRHYHLTRITSQLTDMAQSVLAKPHRFILVSDLDWTMVRTVIPHL